MTDILLTCLLFALVLCIFTFVAVRHILRQMEPLTQRLETMEHEDTERGGPEVCAKCDIKCFAQDWVCLCECHDGNVPLHKIAERKRVMQALGRLTGD